MAEKIRILYLHGMEEKANSPKPMMLKAESDFEVRIPLLHVYPTNKNGLLICLLKNRRFIASMAAGLITTVLGSFVLGLGAAAVGFGLQWRKIVEETIRASVEVSYKIALDNLKEFKPDIVVGFSWGGCLATMLLKKREWNGPAILLGPAYEGILKRMDDKKESGKILVCGEKLNYKEPIFEGLSQVERTERERNIRVAVGGDDSIVKPKKLEKFCEKNNFDFTVIPNNKHNLWGYTQLPEVVRSLL